MSLNSFPVTDLRPEVKLMHLLRMRRHCIMFETDSIGQTPIRMNVILLSQQSLVEL